MRIDLHVHTNASDGLYRPADVAAMAARAGVSVIGIADHDTVDGIDEALEAARDSVRVVPAVEINAYAEGVEHHILGYFVRHRDAELRGSLAKLRDARVARMHVIIGKLAAIGIGVTAEEILAIAGSGTVGRPHIAQALVAKGYASSVRDAFEKYIGEGKPAYAPRSKLTPREAIAIIRAAGGASVLAHPGLWGGGEMVPALAAGGIVGLEVYSPEHTQEQVRRFLDMSRSLGLVSTGGSDFHGWGDTSRSGLGAATTPPEEFARLEEIATRQGGRI